MRQTVKEVQPMRSFGPILLCVSLGLLCAAGGIRAVPIEIDDTWNQRQRAKETAEEAGARKVVNKLTVDLYGPDYYHEEQAP
jgi:hypothetical protein